MSVVRDVESRVPGPGSEPCREESRGAAEGEERAALGPLLLRRWDEEQEVEERGSPSAPVEDLIFFLGGWKGKLTQELGGDPHAQNPVLKEKILSLSLRSLQFREECKNPGK